MNRDRYLTLFAAICCLVAVGTAAGTMDASVTTEPEEAIDIDTRLLPIGTDHLWELHTKVNGAQNGDGERNGASQKPNGDSNAQREVNKPGPERQQQGGQGETRTGVAGGGEKQRASGADDRNGAKSEPKAQQEDRNANSGSTALIDPGWDLVDLLLAFVIGVVALACVCGVVLLGRRLGRRIRERRSPPESTDEPTPPGEPAPANDVSRAWFEMTREVGVDDRHELTPNERAAAAAERGADPEAATSLTRLFEEVRYGQAPVTEGRKERARRWLDRLRSDTSEREKP